MKSQVHITFQNTIPEKALRPTITPFNEFNLLTKEFVISKTEFLEKYAPHLRDLVAAQPINSFQYLLNILDKFFLVHFIAVVNFPIIYKNKTYLINWNKINRRCSQTTHIRYTEVELTYEQIPNKQCCQRTCIGMEVDILLWDKVQTNIRKIENDILKQNEFFLMDHFLQFNRFPVTTENFILVNGCLNPILEVYTEDDISEFFDARKNIYLTQSLYLAKYYQIPDLNKCINIWAPMNITKEVNPFSCSCSLEYMIHHNNEINAILLMECDIDIDDYKKKKDNYIIYLNNQLKSELNIDLILGISDDYKINP